MIAYAVRRRVRAPMRPGTPPLRPGTPRRTLLEAALGMDGKAAPVHAALALCRATAGALQGAYEDLKRAIELQPRKRIIARQDDDFARFANQPPLDRLLGR